MLARYLPILDWGRSYNRAALSNDLIAAVIVTIMLIPQSLAYALLAGLPPEMGLYASIVPIILYAIFGTSRALAVGPVAVVSLMTAAAIGEIAEAGTAGYAIAALTLAGLSGAILLAMGVFKLGFLANFLSHPVIAGFITASGVIIAASQLKHILGVNAQRAHPAGTARIALAPPAGNQPYTLVIGVAATAFLFWVRKGLKPALRKLGLSGDGRCRGQGGAGRGRCRDHGGGLAFGLDARGVAIVGEVPQSLPPLTMPSFDLDLIRTLAVPALLISVIGFVESISVAQTLAAKKRQRIDPDQELIGLGAANMGAAFTGGFPGDGGFSRSVVNLRCRGRNAGGGRLYRRRAGRRRAAAHPADLLPAQGDAGGDDHRRGAEPCRFLDPETHLDLFQGRFQRRRRDHPADPGHGGGGRRVGGGDPVHRALPLQDLAPAYRRGGPDPRRQHFRNIKRYDVLTHPEVVTLRVDESLYFANARFLEDYILNRVAGDDGLKHVVLMCTAVNEVDMSALESLEAINQRLKSMGLKLHLSKVKGPVMDRLKRAHFLDELTGNVYLSQYEAMMDLGPVVGENAPKAAE